MSTLPFRVFVARRQNVLLLRVIGRGIAHGCPALRLHAEQALTSGVERVRIELAECTHLDSTFIGTLLFLSKHPALRAAGSLELVSPSAECRELLKRMCVARLFAIDESAGDFECEWRELSSEFDPNDPHYFKQNVVEAHEALAAVPGPLSECFQAIADSGRQELKSSDRPWQRD